MLTMHETEKVTMRCQIRQVTALSGPPHNKYLAGCQAATGTAATFVRCTRNCSHLSHGLANHQNHIYLNAWWSPSLKKAFKQRKLLELAGEKCICMSLSAEVVFIRYLVTLARHAEEP